MTRCLTNRCRSKACHRESCHSIACRNKSFQNDVHFLRPLARVAAATCALVVSLSMAGCNNADIASNNSLNSASSNVASSDAQYAIDFMLDWTPNTNHIGLYVAQEQGYFNDAGVSVTILPTATAGAESSIENGITDAGFTTLSNVAAFNSQGANLTFVFDLTQKQVARWCALSSRDDITSPKDFDNKTFVSFGSAEQDAVLKQMIINAGGTGSFDTATAGTNTFETLISGHGDFAGFYATWEGVESQLHGPALNCFIAGDWGVPGNPDQLGFAVGTRWLDDEDHQEALRRFLAAAKRGYEYALANPDEAAQILVSANPESNIDLELAKASMHEIIAGSYWTTDGSNNISGVLDVASAQAYLDFQFAAGTYVNAEGDNLAAAPDASMLATNKYVER